MARERRSAKAGDKTKDRTGRPIVISEPEAAELLAVAEEAAAAAAAAVAECLETGSLHVDTKTAGLDLVTNADMASERAISSTILGHRPRDGFLSEEGTARPSHSGITWVVDPIDSTANLARGLPIWSISIAAKAEGRTVAGVVSSPATGERFSSARGQPVLMNGRALSPAATATSLHTALGIIGWAAATSDSRRDQVIARLIAVSGRLRSPGSPALGLAWSAAGRADFAFYEQGLHEWDFAAGLFLCEQQGLRVRLERPEGQPLRLLVANTNLFSELAELVFG